MHVTHLYKEGTKSEHFKFKLYRNKLPLKIKYAKISEINVGEYFPTVYCTQTFTIPARVSLFTLSAPLSEQLLSVYCTCKLAFYMQITSNYGNFPSGHQEVDGATSSLQLISPSNSQQSLIGNSLATSGCQLVSGYVFTYY